MIVFGMDFGQKMQHAKKTNGQHTHLLGLLSVDK